jgi:hypothetical protein
MTFALPTWSGDRVQIDAVGNACVGGVMEVDLDGVAFADSQHRARHRAVEDPVLVRPAIWAVTLSVVRSNLTYAGVSLSMGAATCGAGSGLTSGGSGWTSGGVAMLMPGMSAIDADDADAERCLRCGGGRRVDHRQRALHARVLVARNRAHELQDARRVERELTGRGLTWIRVQRKRRVLHHEVVTTPEFCKAKLTFWPTGF